MPPLRFSDGKQTGGQGVLLSMAACGLLLLLTWCRQPSAWSISTR